MFFLFDDTATAAIYTLSLHDALPIYGSRHPGRRRRRWQHGRDPQRGRGIRHRGPARAGRLDAAQDRVAYSVLCALHGGDRPDRHLYDGHYRPAGRTIKKQKHETSLAPSGARLHSITALSSLLADNRAHPETKLMSELFYDAAPNATRVAPPLPKPRQYPAKPSQVYLFGTC